MPQPASSHAWANPASQCDLRSPCWADDFVQPSSAATPSALISVVQDTAQVLTERATSMGMTLSYGAQKTAVLMPPWVADHSAASFHYDDQGARFLPVHDRLTDRGHACPPACSGLQASWGHHSGQLLATPALTCSRCDQADPTPFVRLQTNSAAYTAHVASVLGDVEVCAHGFGGCPPRCISAPHMGSALR